MSSQASANRMSVHPKVETVDLTLSSSPSPEPSPEPQPRQKLQREHLRRPEPQRISSLLGERHPRTSSATSSGSRSPFVANTIKPLPHVSQDHLRQIIRDSPPQKVAALLLDLCKTSPALSGAVARGLAPHSSWAQSTINDYQRRTGVRRVKSDLGATQSSPAAILKHPPEKRNHGALRTPHPRAPLKFEVGVNRSGVDDSLTDSDDPTPPPGSSKGKVVAGPSSFHRTTFPQTPTASRSDKQSDLSYRVKPEAKTPAPFCMQCTQIIRPNTTCHYHLGRTKMAGRGDRKIWSCCDKAVGAVGCVEGDHIPLEQNIPDPTSRSTGPKKPRLI